MFPYLDLKFIKIPMYGVCILVGIVLAVLTAYFLIKKKKLCIWDFVILAAVAYGMGMLFAKLLFILVTYPKDFFKVIGMIFSGKANNLVSGGFVFYGGVIGGIIGLFIGSKIAHCKLSDFLDIFGVLIPLVHCFGRIGCFCAGCCYGIRYDGIFSVVYHNPITSVPADVGIFPVQLLEAFLVLILFFVLLFLYNKGVKNIVFIYLIAYGVIRFFTECLRFDYERGFVFGISVSQFISIIIIICSVFYLVIEHLIKNKKKSLVEKQ